MTKMSQIADKNVTCHDRNVTCLDKNVTRRDKNVRSLWITSVEFPPPIAQTICLPLLRGGAPTGRRGVAVGVYSIKVSRAD